MQTRDTQRKLKSITLTIDKGDYHTQEAFKSLRTNLRFCGEDKKVICLTSCTPNEGKTSIGLNLAKSLGESGQRVLLLDADLRKSVMMGRVGIENTEEIQGLTHYLSGQAKLEDILYADVVNRMHVIFSGPFPPNPSELLGSRKFKDLMRMLRGVFDYIIVDTPPIGSVIDTAVIAESCDGIVFVVAQGEISYRFAQDAKAQLERTGVPILGAILNKVSERNDSYGGYYGRYGAYGRYGRYGKYGKYGNKYGDYGDLGQDATEEETAAADTAAATETLIVEQAED